MHKVVRDVCASLWPSVLLPGSLCLSSIMWFVALECVLKLGSMHPSGGWGLGSLPGTLSRGWVEGHRLVLLCARDTQSAGRGPSSPVLAVRPWGTHWTSVPMFPRVQRQACCSPLTVLPKGEVRSRRVDAEDAPFSGRCLAGRF